MLVHECRSALGDSAKIPILTSGGKKRSPARGFACRGATFSLFCQLPARGACHERAARALFRPYDRPTLGAFRRAHSMRWLAVLILFAGGFCASATAQVAGCTNDSNCVGGALTLNGNNQYVDVPRSPSFDNVDSLEALTVELWLYLSP